MATSMYVGALYVAFGAVPAYVAVETWEHRDRPGGGPLVVALLGAVGVAVGYGLELLVAGTGGPRWLEAATHAGSVLGLDAAALGAFYLAVEYTGRTSLERRWIVGGLVGVAIPLTIADAALWSAGAAGVGAVRTAEMLFHVLLATATLFMFGERAALDRGVYRKQSTLLFAGFGIATALSVLQRLLTTGPVNLVAIGTTTGVVMIALALRHYRFLTTAPIARATAFEYLADPVLVFDGDGTIVACNDPAREVFGLERPEGRAADDVFDRTPALARRYEDALAGGEIGVVVAGDRRHAEPDHPAMEVLREGAGPSHGDLDFGVYSGGEVRYFHLTSSSIGTGTRRSGRVVVCREITAEKEKEQELDLLKQVLSRVLRHNIRNDLTKIQGHAVLVRERAEDGVAEHAEEIIEISEGLEQTSRKARSIEAVLEADEVREIPVAETIETAVASISEQYPDADYEVDVPDDLTVRANPLLEAGITSLVENAVVHTEVEPSVRVTATLDRPWVEIAISDSGPGIPSAELETLQRGGETALVHSSGAGLWLAQTVVDQSGGDLLYDVDEGTTARVRLPAGEST